MNSDWMLIEARNIASEAFGKQQVRPGHDDRQSYDPENLLLVIWILKWSICLCCQKKSEENGKSLFRRKRQSRNNCCPFDRKPYLDEEIKIRVHNPGKGRVNTTSTQKDKTISWRSKIWRIPQDPLILRDRCFKTYLYFWYFHLAIIKRDSAGNPGGRIILSICRTYCCKLNFDHRLSLKSDHYNSAIYD